jgi:glucose/arabinose dehydrogenase
MLGIIVIAGRDGALLVADDVGNKIWRVSPANSNIVAQ